MNWKFFALGSAFFAGLTAVLSKVGVEDISSNFATLFRTVVIVLFMTALVTARGEWRSPTGLPARSLIFLVLSALATGFSWLCYFRALQLAPASVVAPIDKLSLIFAIVMAVIFLGERLSVLQWTGAALMTGGAVLIILK